MTIRTRDTNDPTQDWLEACRQDFMYTGALPGAPNRVQLIGVVPITIETSHGMVGIGVRHSTDHTYRAIFEVWA